MKTADPKSMTRATGVVLRLAGEFIFLAGACFLAWVRSPQPVPVLADGFYDILVASWRAGLLVDVALLLSVVDHLSCLGGALLGRASREPCLASSLIGVAFVVLGAWQTPLVGGWGFSALPGFLPEHAAGLCLAYGGYLLLRGGRVLDAVGGKPSAGPSEAGA